jgi:hypothetical protein
VGKFYLNLDDIDNNLSTIPPWWYFVFDNKGQPARLKKLFPPGLFLEADEKEIRLIESKRVSAMSSRHYPYKWKSPFPKISTRTLGYYCSNTDLQECLGNVDVDWLSTLEKIIVLPEEEVISLISLSKLSE